MSSLPESEPLRRSGKPLRYEVEMKVKAPHSPILARLDALGARMEGVVHQEDLYFQAPDRDFAATDEALRIRHQSQDDSGAPFHQTDPPDQVAPSHQVIPPDQIASSHHPDSPRRTSYLTYKGPRVEADSKTRLEREVLLPDPDAMEAILQALGFQPTGRVRKLRRRYRVQGYEVALDGVEGLGEFVEVEGEAGEEDRAAVAEGCRSLLQELGLDPSEQIRRSYLELLREAGS
jgi:adenylate cyclase, class 2